MEIPGPDQLAALNGAAVAVAGAAAMEQIVFLEEVRCMAPAAVALAAGSQTTEIH